MVKYNNSTIVKIPSAMVSQFHVRTISKRWFLSIVQKREKKHDANLGFKKATYLLVS